MRSNRGTGRRYSVKESAQLLMCLANTNTRPSLFSPSAKEPLKHTKTRLLPFSDKLLLTSDKENSTNVIHRAAKPLEGVLRNKPQKKSLNDVDATTAASQLLAFKSQAPENRVRFDETVQVFEFKRRIGDVPARLKMPNNAALPSPSIKYALAIDWAQPAGFSKTLLNDKRLSRSTKSFEPITPVPMAKRCRLLVADVGLAHVASDTAQKLRKTTSREKQLVLKDLNDFLRGIKPSPP